VLAGERHARDLIGIVADPYHKDRDEGPPLGLIDLDIIPKILSVHETTVEVAGGSWKLLLQNRNGIGTSLIFLTGVTDTRKFPLKSTA
jgi:hypothetical protein